MTIDDVIKRNIGEFRENYPETKIVNLSEAVERIYAAIQTGELIPLLSEMTVSEKAYSPFVNSYLYGIMITMRKK